MDFTRLTVFLAVARQLSFRGAAASLHLSQPAVSKHIQKLEAELALALFERRGSRVALTEAGQMLQDYGERVAALTGEMRRALGELQGLQRGALRIGASTTPGLYLLPERLAPVREWIASYERFWDDRLARFQKLLAQKQLPQKPPTPKSPKSKP